VKVIYILNNLIRYTEISSIEHHSQEQDQLEEKKKKLLLKRKEEKQDEIKNSEA
jgi:hypothetical protein